LRASAEMEHVQVAGHVGILDAPGDLHMLHLGRREVAQQLARIGRGGPRRGLQIEAAGIGLHLPRLTADRLDAARQQLPGRLVGRRAAHVLAADRRDLLAEAADVQVDQGPAMLAFLGGHAVEHLRGVGIGLAQRLGEVGIKLAVLLLVGDREGEHFLLVQVGEAAHASASNVATRQVKTYSQ
jgi:hypothetical protein